MSFTDFEEQAFNRVIITGSGRGPAYYAAELAGKKRKSTLIITDREPASENFVLLTPEEIHTADMFGWSCCVTDSPEQAEAAVRALKSAGAELSAAGVTIIVDNAESISARLAVFIMKEARDGCLSGCTVIVTIKDIKNVHMMYALCGQEMTYEDIAGEWTIIPCRKTETEDMKTPED